MGVSAVASSRHLTAMRRVELSRPIRLALEDRLLAADQTLFDYGCGHGEDVERLRKRGFDSWGWDPVYSPHDRRPKSDVVNLGYVVNVIEDVEERAQALQTAWGYAQRLLIVSARLTSEVRARCYDEFGDGIVTTRGTFQKFFDQDELRDWIEATLGVASVAAAPGIFYIFRDAKERESFTASRYRARVSAPRVRRSDEVFEANRELLGALIDFLKDRGRLPEFDELNEAADIEKELGSLRRAFGVIKRVTESADWTRVREERKNELLLYLALVRFSGRPKFSQLPRDLQLDVRGFFGTYTRACRDADNLLFSVGDLENVNRACSESPVGKLTAPALYVHSSAIGYLPPILRVFEGCARGYVGTVEESNMIKLHRDEPKVSYLVYPNFDTDPHPSLSYSATIHLQTFRIREADYSQRDNPPILHRKETFVSSDHPLCEKFSRLTQAGGEIRAIRECRDDWN